MQDARTRDGDDRGWNEEKLGGEAVFIADVALQTRSIVFPGLRFFLVPDRG